MKIIVAIIVISVYGMGQTMESCSHGDNTLICTHASPMSESYNGLQPEFATNTYIGKAMCEKAEGVKCEPGKITTLNGYILWNRALKAKPVVHKPKPKVNPCEPWDDAALPFRGSAKGMEWTCHTKTKICIPHEPAKNGSDNTNIYTIYGPPIVISIRDPKSKSAEDSKPIEVHYTISVCAKPTDNNCILLKFPDGSVLYRKETK